MTQVQIAELIEEAARLEGIARGEWQDMPENEAEDGQPVFFIYGDGLTAVHEKFTAPKPRDDREGFIKSVRAGFNRAAKKKGGKK
jgi:hypothetical protein